MALANIMEAFRTAPVVSTPAIDNKPSAENPTNPTNPTGTESTVVTPEENKSPLDQFDKLWQTPENKGTEPPAGVFGEINPAKIAEIAGKVNFAQVVKKDDLTAIQAGGEEAINALGRALNAVSQTVYAQSAMATTKLIEQASSKIEENLLKTLPDKFKAFSLSSSLREENPVYSHPGAEPIVSMIQNQLSVKHPNATTSELKQMAQDYFSATFEALSPKQKEAETNSKSKGIIDWGAELGV